MVVYCPECGEANYAVKEVTEAEMKNQEEYWILGHGELLHEFSLDSQRKVIEVEKCKYGHYVTNSSNDSNTTNN